MGDDVQRSITIVYVVGVVWGLLRTDARPLERVMVSLCWPLGPIAFVVTLTILLAASLLAYPLVMVPAVAVVVALWWTLS